MFQFKNYGIKQINAHLPWLLIMFLITVQSAMTSEELDVNLPGMLDKIIHFMIFGVLGWLMVRGFTKNKGSYLFANFLWLVPLIGGFFGILDEFHQATVPGRFADPLDWLADILGIVIFMLLFKKKFIQTKAQD